ncbi:MAG: 30S ribosomal protein S20 [Clostridia bacterium]
MPNIKTAKKRVLINETKALRNQSQKSALKTSIKALDIAIETGDKAKTEVAYKDAVSKLDKATQQNLLHINKAAHKKSQLTAKANAILNAKPKKATRAKKATPAEA